MYTHERKNSPSAFTAHMITYRNIKLHPQGLSILYTCMLTLTCTCTYTILYNYIINIDLLSCHFHILYHSLATNRSVSDHTYNYQHQLQTDVCSGQLKPCSGQEVNLEKSNSQVVGDGMQLITYGHCLVLEVL